MNRLKLEKDVKSQRRKKCLQSKRKIDDSAIKNTKNLFQIKKEKQSKTD